MPCCAICRRLESGSEKHYLIIKELWEGEPLPVCFCNQGFRAIIVVNMIDAEMLWQYILVDIDDLSEILTILVSLCLGRRLKFRVKIQKLWSTTESTKERCACQRVRYCAKELLNVK